MGPNSGMKAYVINELKMGNPENKKYFGDSYAQTKINEKVAEKSFKAEAILYSSRVQFRFLPNKIEININGICIAGIFHVCKRLL